MSYMTSTTRRHHSDRRSKATIRLRLIVKRPAEKIQLRVQTSGQFQRHPTLHNTVLKERLHKVFYFYTAPTNFDNFPIWRSSEERFRGWKIFRGAWVKDFRGLKSVEIVWTRSSFSRVHNWVHCSVCGLSLRILLPSLLRLSLGSSRMLESLNARSADDSK